MITLYWLSLCSIAERYIYQITKDNDYMCKWKRKEKRLTGRLGSKKPELEVVTESE